MSTLPENQSPTEVDVRITQHVSVSEIVSSYVHLYTEELKKVQESFKEFGSGFRGYYLKDLRENSDEFDFEPLIPQYAKDLGKQYGLYPVFSNTSVCDQVCFPDLYLKGKRWNINGAFSEAKSIWFVDLETHKHLKEGNSFRDLRLDFSVSFAIPLTKELKKKVEEVFKESREIYRQRKEEIRNKYPLLSGLEYHDMIHEVLRKPIKDSVSSWITVQVLNGKVTNQELIKQAMNECLGEMNLEYFKQKLEEKRKEDVEYRKFLEETKEK